MASLICRVCLESLQEKTVISTQCGHLFCSECANSVFSRRPTPCPVCRAPQSRRSLIRLFPEWGTPSEDAVARTLPDRPAPRNSSNRRETPNVNSRPDGDAAGTTQESWSSAFRPTRRVPLQDAHSAVDPDPPEILAFRFTRRVSFQPGIPQRSVNTTTIWRPSASNNRGPTRPSVRYWGENTNPISLRAEELLLASAAARLSISPR